MVTNLASLCGARLYTCEIHLKTKIRVILLCVRQIKNLQKRTHFRFRRVNPFDFFVNSLLLLLMMM